MDHVLIPLNHHQWPQFCAIVDAVDEPLVQPYPDRTLVLMDLDCVVHGDIEPVTAFDGDIGITVIARNLPGRPDRRWRVGVDRKWRHQITVHTPLNKSEAGNAGEKEIVESAKELADTAGMPVGMIIVDTVAWAMQGDDENSTQDMNAFVSRLQVISQETGAAVIAVHHPGKDEARGMRGSYVLYNGVDVVMKVETYADGDTPQKRLFAE